MVGWLLLTGGFTAGMIVTLGACILLLWLHARAMDAEVEAENIAAIGRRPSWDSGVARPPAGGAMLAPNGGAWPRETRQDRHNSIYHCSAKDSYGSSIYDPIDR
jgi:hypothetical protein